MTGDRIGIVEGIPGADRAVFDLIESELPDARFYPFAGVWQHGLPAGPGQVWISTRFHTHMLAAAGVAVSINAGYYSTKHRSLLDRGTGWVLAEDLQIPQRPTQGGFEPATLRSP